MFYSKSKSTFYAPEIHGNSIPSDAVEISREQWQSLLDAQSSGKIIQADKKGFPIAVDPPAPTKSQTLSPYNVAAQQNLDSVAKKWGYDSLVSAASYANSTNAQFKADAEALITWRDAYWVEAYLLQEGTLPSAVEDFIAMLPVAPKQPKL